MNDNFDFSNDFNNEINMSEEERKSHKKIFSKLAFGILAYFLIFFKKKEKIGRTFIFLYI